MDIYIYNNGDSSNNNNSHSCNNLKPQFSI